MRNARLLCLQGRSTVPARHVGRNGKHSGLHGGPALVRLSARAERVSSLSIFYTHHPRYCSTGASGCPAEAKTAHSCARYHGVDPTTYVLSVHPRHMGRNGWWQGRQPLPRSKGLPLQSQPGARGGSPCPGPRGVPLNSFPSFPKTSVERVRGPGGSQSVCWEAGDAHRAVCR